MLVLAFAFLTTLGIAAPATPQATPVPSSARVFSSVSLYQGNWQVDPGMSGKGPDTLSNHCEEFTEYYACQQTVNGKVGALIVFVYAGTTGHYNTQAILPNGFAQGRGDLLIEGQRWTFSGKSTDSGNTTYFRTINDWYGHDRIHFEVAHSTDGKTWVIDHQGDERRTQSK
ncbi:MAG: hypothetical protein ACYCSP_00790 [Acidobacteriaceae bacterium]